MARIRKISPETIYRRNRSAILGQFSDYGYGLSPEEAFVDQIDRMVSAGENPYATIHRFIQGGGVLVYNEDIVAYMEKKLGIPCADDPDVFGRYCRLMAADGFRLYNEVKSKGSTAKAKPKTKPKAKPKSDPRKRGKT